MYSCVLTAFIIKRISIS